MRTKTFLEALSERVLLCDGAMGTELQKRCPENPLDLFAQLKTAQDIHREYFAAGADIIETNTFNANRLRMEKFGIQPDQVVRFNQRAARVALEVRPEGCFVAGCIGPTGFVLEPFGTMSTAAAKAVFAEQVEILADSGVDAIFIETMLALNEMEAAVQAAKSSTRLPVVATMVFKSTQRGLRTDWGVTVAEAVQKLTEFGADVLGVNCCGPTDALLIIEEMKSLTGKPLIAQPNAGEDMESVAKELLHLGVSILGGCCETTPAHIGTMAKVLTEL